MTVRDLFARVALSGMAVLVGSALPASPSNGDFVSEPDQSLAAARNSFAKGDKNGAAAVRKMSDEVGRDVKKSVDKATADGAEKAGQDTSHALHKAFLSLDGAAHWSGAPNSTKGRKKSSRAQRIWGVARRSPPMTSVAGSSTSATASRTWAKM